ncbi:MAG TPA: hypothetical protein VNQ79_09660, partial [Blastocatellia bacterium]|nr:hypothetical protein [Blastocatellia bacterium]
QVAFAQASECRPSCDLLSVLVNRKSDRMMALSALTTIRHHFLSCREPGFNAAGIGANDFVYFFRITNTTGTGIGGAPVFPINVFQTGYCSPTITSVGFYHKAGADPSTNTTLFQNPGLVTFNWSSDVIDPGEDSAILFFTSPDPPSRQAVTISGGGGTVGGVSSNGQKPTGSSASADDQVTIDPNLKLPVYGPCLAKIEVDKKIGCSQNGPFTDGPETASDGSDVWYQITVSNKGSVPLTNITVQDPLLIQGGDLKPLFSVQDPFLMVRVAPIPGQGIFREGLDPGQMRKIVVKRRATSGIPVPGDSMNGLNTVMVTGEYLIQNQDGSVSTQSQVVSNKDEVNLDVKASIISCEKLVNGASNLTTPDNAFPLTLTYTLKATNNGVTNLDLTLDDPKLKDLKTNPPPGITPGGDMLPKVCTGVAPNGMCQATVTLTLDSKAAFQAPNSNGNRLSDTPSSLTTTNIMKATGRASGPAGCTSTVMSECTAIVNLATIPTKTCIVTKCVGDACRGSDPGMPTPDVSPVSDQRPGSVLVYNLYTSNIASPATENTRLNITNTAQGSVFVHLFFVDGETCSVADSFICLSANQSCVLFASDIDPGIRGYVVAVAVDEQGCPIKWNYLIGDEYVKLQSGHAANLAAEGFAAILNDPTGCNANSSTVPLRLDGVHYNSAPRVLAVDNILSIRDANSTLLVINRLGGELNGNADSVGALFGLLFDGLEKAYSFTTSSARCQFINTLSTNFPRTTPRLDTVIPVSQSGWMKLWSVNEYGLIGSVLVFNPNAASNSSAYSQGHNLHLLRLGGIAEYTFPVFPPNVP